MKAILIASAALVLAGAAAADEVRVVTPPGSDTRVIVKHITFPPDAFVGVPHDDGQGMLSSDEVGAAAPLPDIDFGFDPDAVIYIWSDEKTGQRIVRRLD